MLTPVGGADLADLRAIKADPRVFAIMLGGVRTPTRDRGGTGRGRDRLGRQRLRHLGDPREPRHDRFVGITGLERRPDGRGVALRFALWPEAQGRGLAREAAGAALRFGHDQAGLRRIVAVARESNFASRMVLGGIGMTECGSFMQNGSHAWLHRTECTDRSPSARACATCCASR